MNVAPIGGRAVSSLFTLGILSELVRQILSAVLPLNLLGPPLDRWADLDRRSFLPVGMTCL